MNAHDKAARTMRKTLDHSTPKRFLMQKGQPRVAQLVPAVEIRTFQTGRRPDIIGRRSGVGQASDRVK